MKHLIRRSAGRLQWPLVLALLLGFVAAWPLLASPGLVETRAGGDSPFLLARTQQLVEALRDGVFPVRWMDDGAYGMGYPFFNFYASLPYYAAAVLKRIGFTYVNAIKMIQILGLLAAALGAYALALRLWPNRWGALLTSAAYTFAPFHLVNLYVRGDSLSEFWAFAFYPFILLAALRLWYEPTLPRASALALTFGGLALTHNVSALLFSPFVALFLLFLFLRHREAGWRPLLYAGGALALGLAVSAWFWAPALLERSLVHLEVQTTGYFFYGGHFRGANLVQMQPLFQYAVDASGTPFAMGLVQALLILAGVAWIVYSSIRRRRVDSAEIAALVFLALATWLITPLSRVAWANVPLLPFAQFPWRFLSIQALAAALVVGRLADVRPARRWTMELALLVALSAAVTIHPTYLHVSDADVTAERLALYEAFTGNVGSTVRAEYLPMWTSPRPYTGEMLWTDAKPAPRAVSGSLDFAQLRREEAGFQEWTVSAPAEARVVFQTLYYPGWRAFVNGQEVPVEAQPGWGGIALTVPQGTHQVILRFGTTTRRLVTEIISLLALVACIVMALAGKQPLRRAAQALGVAGGSLAILALVGLLTTATAPSYAGDDLTMDWAVGPYLSHNPQGVAYQGGASLQRYEMSKQSAAPADTLQATLQWAGASEGLTVRLTLEGMAAPLFGVLDVLSVSEAQITGGRSTHALEVPGTLPPGTYLLGVRLFSGSQELRPMAARGKTVAQTYLQPVRVAGTVRLAQNVDLTTPFGDSVALWDVQTQQNRPGQLQVSLVWAASRQLPQNYAVSVRLVDRAGAILAQHDSQPNYGFSPTSLWLPGQPVLDRHWLGLPPGLLTGETYAVQAILYDPNTLAALGSATVPGIRLSLVDVRESYPVLQKFGPELALSALEVEKTEAWQGERIAVRGTWAAVQATTKDYALRLQLRRPDGEAVWETREPLVSDSLPQNGLVTRRSFVEVPVHLAFGAYTLTLSVEDGQGASLGEHAFSTPIMVRERERTFSAPAMSHKAGIFFAEEIALLGYDIGQSADALTLTLHWQAQARPAEDRKVFVHLFAPDTETIVAQWDSQPRRGEYPTTQWAPGEVVSEEVTLSLNAVAPGAYRLAIGLYGPGPDRLKARQTDGTSLPGDRFVPPEVVTVR